MEGFDASTYGDRIAEVYDDLYGELFDAEATVEFLAELAGGGRALELGIGTGRIAVPLADAGVEVVGIDSSEAMVKRLRAKPGGEDIPVTIADFVEVDVEGEFAVVYIPFNTLFALTTQDEQVRCFENVARHLTDVGVFVVEAFVPDPSRYDRHQRVSVDRVENDRVVLEVSRHDPVRQSSDSQHVVIGERETKLYPISIRYAYPSELDLMARLTGLRLRERFGGWHKEPFTSASVAHVSVYARGTR
ncbi:MAG: class I SAM-dependent DNA methyltransferase [Actinomycetota bacterium]